MTTSKKPKSSSAVEKQKEARITVLKGKGLAAKDSNGTKSQLLTFINFFVKDCQIHI